MQRNKLDQIIKFRHSEAYLSAASLYEESQYQLTVRFIFNKFNSNGNENEQVRILIDSRVLMPQFQYSNLRKGI